MIQGRFRSAFHDMHDMDHSMQHHEPPTDLLSVRDKKTGAFDECDRKAQPRFETWLRNVLRKHRTKTTEWW
jgi:hypothetical protein